MEETRRDTRNALEATQEESPRAGRAGSLLGPLALLTAAALWGGTYSINKLALEHVEPLFLSAAHNALALTVMLPVAAPRVRRAPRNAILGAVGMGVLTTGSAFSLLQGLTGTSPGLSAFIVVQLSVVTPLLAALFGIGRVTRRLGLAILFVLSGMAVVFLLGERTAYSLTTLWLPLATVLLSVHMLGVNYLTHRSPAIVLVWVQAIVTCLLSGLLAAALGQWPASIGELPAAVPLAVMYSGLAGSLGAFLLQTLGQRRTPVTHAGIFISLESVIALLISVAAGLEALGSRRLLGFALILAGTLVAQTDAGKLQREAEEARAELGPPG